MVNKRLFRSGFGLALMSSTLLLSACDETTIGQARRAVDGQTKDAASLLSEGHYTLKPEDTSPVKFMDDAYTTNKALRSDHGDPLPFNVETPGITAVYARAMTLRDIVDRLSHATKLPIRIDADVLGTAKTPGGGSGGASSGSAAAVGPNSSPSAGMATAMESAGMSMAHAGQTTTTNGVLTEASDSGDTMVLNEVNQPLSAILNRVGSYFGVSWSWDGNHIRIFKRVTRIYHIHALPLSGLSVSNSITGSSTTNAGTGQSTKANSAGSSQTTSSQMAINVWSDIENGVNTIVGTSGQVTPSSSTETITVTAPADEMDRVQAFIDHQNKILSRMVKVNVEVLDVTLSASDELNFDLGGALSTAASTMAFGGAGTVTKAATASASSGQVLGASLLSGKLADTSMLIQMLSKWGKVSVVTRAQIMTLNGMPAPMQVTHTYGYLASVQTMMSTISSSGSSSNSQTTLTPGSVSVGFNMTLLPEVLPGDKELMLQFGISLSQLAGATNGFDKYTSGNMTIQLPNVISRQFSQETVIPNGKTLVLSGFEQAEEESNKAGSGTPDNLALGGTQTGERDREMIVVLLTPVVESHEVISVDE